MLEADASAFLVAGPRAHRVPALLPGAEAVLRWALVPLECGFVRAPHVRVLDRRDAGAEEGVVVRVVDTRHQGRGEKAGEDLRVVTRIEEEVARAVGGAPTKGEPEGWGVGPVLVLP
jgi:hypothetical protein